MPISLAFHKNRLKTKLVGRLTPPFVVLDYPREREVIRHPFYSVRVGAEGGHNVEVSVDGGTWQRCRHAVGFWWFDWPHVTPGVHTIVARLITPMGQVKKTKPRTCRAIF
ncbi:MAG: hypothetical protein HYZ73_02155 [Elusimicrobia bacterium]|nr:hypothetical protein [Elusimicrobiota bacterium]